MECEPPTQGASLIPARLVNKFTPISPTKCKSSDEVITLFKEYKNTKDIGKLAIALAKYTYFGSSVMAHSTVTGRGGTTPLNAVELQHLRSNIRAIFPLMDDAEFDKIWDKCMYSYCRMPQEFTIWDYIHVSGSATTVLPPQYCLTHHTLVADIQNYF